MPIDQTIQHEGPLQQSQETNDVTNLDTCNFNKNTNSKKGAKEFKFPKFASSLKDLAGTFSQQSIGTTSENTKAPQLYYRGSKKPSW